MAWENVPVLANSMSSDILGMSGNFGLLRSAFASDTAPASPVMGQIFYKNLGGNLYEKYEYNGIVWNKTLDSGILIPDALIPSPFTTPGGRKLKTVTLSADTTIDLDEHCIFVDATDGVVLLTLPDASEYPGAVFLIKKTDSSGNVVTLSGVNTFDGASTIALSPQYDFAYVVSDGENWMLFS